MGTLRVAAVATAVVIALAVAAPAGLAAPKKPTLKAAFAALDRSIAKDAAAGLRPDDRRVLRALLATAASTAAKRPCRSSQALIGYRNRLAMLRGLAGHRTARVRALARLGLRGAVLRARVLATLTGRKGCGGPNTVDVDPSLRPAKPALPSLAGGPRPLARVVGADGQAADFVANELVVATDDRAALAAVLHRWRGREIATFKPEQQGLPPGPDLHLLRIDASRADADALGADLDRLQQKVDGTATRTSSESGDDLLAAAASEALRGTKVAVNWVGSGADYAHGSTADSASGPGGWSTSGPGWSPDAYTWSHLAAGTTQNMGVASAWTLLARTGRTANRVKLAVLDMGFAPETNGPDFGAGVDAISNVPFTTALGTANLLGCSGGGRCAWHGTNVANAAWGVPDNRSGAAGTGGPVVDPIVVFTLYDFFTSIAAIGEAAAAGARIVNMSYGADVPAVFAWTVLPFEATTGIARAGGMLLFAAAGNSNTDVDDVDCFVVCWESTLHTPCENAGVDCVGALGMGSRSRDTAYSNWGHEAVHIWAPGTVLVGSDPSSGGVHQVSGTSFASPYAAGVAALVWAANPSLSADDVERIMRRTSQASPDADVGSYLNAEAAVRDALPPTVHIEQPSAGQTITGGLSTTLGAFVYDDGLGTSAVRWSAGGHDLGTGATLSTAALPYGPTTVTVTATLGDGSTVTDSVAVTVSNTPPTLSIVTPAPGASFVQGETVTFRGTSGDSNQAPSFALSDAQVAWFVDGATTAFTTGHAAPFVLNTALFTVGMHTIHFRGTDDGGLTAEATVTIQVGAAGPNHPPSVSVAISPTPDFGNNYQALDGQDGTGYYKTVSLLGTTSDPDGDGLTYTWTDRSADSPAGTVSATPVILGTTEDLSGIRLHNTNPFTTFHRLRLTVSDGVNTRFDEIVVGITVPA